VLDAMVGQLPSLCQQHHLLQPHQAFHSKQPSYLLAGQSATSELAPRIILEILDCSTIAAMATQYTTDIPFSASHEQQAFKLLELPPELLALFESDNPPMYHVPSTACTPNQG
jgi:hypothetical protein